MWLGGEVGAIRFPRKRSVAGRVRSPFGALSGVPPALPPVIRIL